MSTAPAKRIIYSYPSKSAAEYTANGVFLDCDFTRSDPTHVLDRSGHYTGSIGSCPSPAAEALYAGTGLQFDGVNDYVDFGDVTQLDNATAFTISGWFRPGANTAIAALCGKMGASVVGIACATTANPCKLMSVVGAGYGINTDTVYRVGQWQHVSMVFDGSGATNADRLIAYVDGEAVGLTYPVDIPATAPNLAGGTLYVAVMNVFHALGVQSLKLQTHPMTAAEVRQEYLQAAQHIDWQVSGEDVPVSVVPSHGVGEFLGDWQLVSGTAKVSEDASDVRWLEGVTTNDYATPQTAAFGTWVFRVTTVAVPDLYYVFVSDNRLGLTAPGSNGYAVRIYGDKLALVCLTAGVAVELFVTSDDYLAPSTDYQICVSRRKTNGLLSVWIRGGTFDAWTLVDATGGAGTNPIVDTTYVASSYSVVHSNAGEKICLYDPRYHRAHEFPYHMIGELDPSADGLPRAVHHVLGTGQSLSLGTAGGPPLSTTPSGNSRRFNTGVVPGGTNLTFMVPIIENTVETMSSGMAALSSALSAESHDMLVSCHGVGNTAYAGLAKGTAPYIEGMAQVSAAKAICASHGLSYDISAVTVVHGESDHVRGNLSYDSDLATWQSDYETDTQALTGQTSPVPMLHTQMSSWTHYGQATSVIQQAQLDASVAAPDKLVLVCPKYFLSYAADGVHLTNIGYRHMGEYYGKAYYRVVVEGNIWQPLRPLTATLSGAEITVEFLVPAPPLVIDTVLVTDPGDNGFEFYDDSGSPPAISSVAIVGPSTVKVTLAVAPTGANKRLRYAYTGTPGANAGPTTGARGNLRDSDATASLVGNHLYNWCVHFDMAVT